MSQNIAILTLPLELAEAVRAHTFVDLSGRAAEPGGPAFGVAAANGDLSGVAGARDTVAVDVLGTAQVVAGGAIPRGAQVAVGPGGAAVECVGGAVVVGRALEAARAAGDVVEVLLIQS